uniref:Uncharacterized protein n=1 Tax=Anguilla anguilla TaxID=7936 RepID=A0A0E9RT01_ANGAN
MPVYMMLSNITLSFSIMQRSQYMTPELCGKLKGSKCIFHY